MTSVLRIGTRSRWAAAALVLGLVATGCGGDSSESSSASPSAAESASETSASPSASETSASPSATASASETAGPTELKIAFVPATTGLLLNVAKEQGFFDDNGLSVELMPATNISDVIPALGQQFDISLGTATDLIRAGASGLDVVQILGNTNSTEDNPFVKLVVGPDSGISDITGLEGKTVGSPTLSGVIHVATLYWAQQNGVDPTTIKGVQVPPPNLVDQFNSGQVDAVEALEPAASQLLGMGNTSLGDPFAAIGLPLATNFWVANGQWAADNPDAVDGFAAAMEQAKQFVEGDEAAARKVLEGYTGLPPAVAEKVALPTFNLEIRTEDLATWIDVLTSLGDFDSEVSPEDLVFSPTG